MPTGFAYCPLDRVLTYKNLIYLLNLQFYCKLVFKFVTTAIMSDNRELQGYSVFYP